MKKPIHFRIKSYDKPSISYAACSPNVGYWTAQNKFTDSADKFLDAQLRGEVCKRCYQVIMKAARGGK